MLQRCWVRMPAFCTPGSSNTLHTHPRKTPPCTRPPPPARTVRRQSRHDHHTCHAVSSPASWPSRTCSLRMASSRFCATLGLALRPCFRRSLSTLQCSLLTCRFTRTCVLCGWCRMSMLDVVVSVWMGRRCSMKVLFTPQSSAGRCARRRALHCTAAAAPCAPACPAPSPACRPPSAGPGGEGMTAAVHKVCADRQKRFTCIWSRCGGCGGGGRGDVPHWVLGQRPGRG